MLGMEMLVKSVVENLDSQTKQALEAIPRNVQAIAQRLKGIEDRLEAQNLCSRLEGIEIAIVGLDAKLERLLSDRPGYTPDDPLPTLLSGE